MPFVDAGDGTGHRIFYRTYWGAEADSDTGEASCGSRPSAVGAVAATAAAGELAKRPRILLLMGLGGSHTYWRLQAEHFSGWCDVCAVDNRGAGFSVGAWVREGRWTTRQLAGDASRVLDALGWDAAVHVVGISMGGMVAQELAISAPERVASLTLLCTYASAMHAMPAPQVLLDLARSFGLLTSGGMKQAEASFRLNYPEEWLRQQRPSSLHGGAVVENMRWARKLAVQMALEVPAELLAELGQGPGPKAGPPPLGTLLRQLTAVLTHRVSSERCAELRRRGVPISIVTGDEDVLVRPENSRVLARLLGAPVHVLPACGHGVIHQAPEEVNALIEASVREGERRLGASGRPDAQLEPASRL